LFLLSGSGNITSNSTDVLEAHTGAVTLIQRFGSALNLNLHFHALFIDGVFSPKSNGEPRFHRVNAPTSKELNALVATISERVADTWNVGGAQPGMVEPR